MGKENYHSSVDNGSSRPDLSIYLISFTYYEVVSVGTQSICLRELESGTFSLL